MSELLNTLQQLSANYVVPCTTTSWLPSPSTFAAGSILTLLLVRLRQKRRQSVGDGRASIFQAQTLRCGFGGATCEQPRSHTGSGGARPFRFSVTLPPSADTWAATFQATGETRATIKGYAPFATRAYNVSPASAGCGLGATENAGGVVAKSSPQSVTPMLQTWYSGKNGNAGIGKVSRYLERIGCTALRKFLGHCLTTLISWNVSSSGKDCWTGAGKKKGRNAY